jgi:hypothetical protein
MIGALLATAWRERLSRPVVLVLLVVGSALILAHVLVGNLTELREDLVSPVLVMALVFGAGLVGKDASSGALALMFTRPIKRWQYVFTRWIGAAVAATTFSLVHLALQFVLLFSRGQGVPAAALGRASFEAATSSFGVTALLLALSTLVPGLGDLALWIALTLLPGLVVHVGVPQRICDHLEQVAFPRLDWADAAGGGTSAWFAIASYASNVTLFLALAVWVMNRKQVSYATS